MLTLSLLGPFEASVEGGRRLRLPTQKSVALLAYLALNREGPVARDFLAALLWNDVPLRQGRHSLRQELTHIRTAIGPASDVYLVADRSTVALRHEHLRVDAERLVELVTRHTSDSIREACALYRGELLANLHTRERAFDAWLEATRKNLSRLAIIALEYRLKELVDLSDRAGALTIARQLFALDPESDTPYRRMMSLYAAGEDADAAAPVEDTGLRVGPRDKPLAE